MPIPAAPEIFLLPLSGSQSQTEDRGSPAGQTRLAWRAPSKNSTVSGISGNGQRYPAESASAHENHLENLLEHCFLGDDANAVLKVFVDLTQLENISGPVVLYGPPQTGKSFLARGLAQRLASFRSYRRLLLAKNSSDSSPPEDGSSAHEPKQASALAICQDKAICLSAADLAVQLQDAVDTNSLAEFRNRFLRAGAVQIDDLQQLNHSPFTQSQLVILLDLLEQSQVPVVITLSRLPSQFTELRCDLTSRLMGGLVLPIELPGPQAKRIALLHYSRHAGLRFSADAISWLAEQAPLSTFSSLKGFVGELTLRSSGSGRPARNVFELSDVIDWFVETANSSADQLPGLIIETVAAFFELSTDQLKGPCRRQTTVLARGLALTVIRSLCPLSLSGLGSLFGNRDHSTVLNALQSTDEKLKSDPGLRVMLTQVMSQLKQLAAQLRIPLTATSLTNDKTTSIGNSKANC